MTFADIDQIKKEFVIVEDDPKEIRKKLRKLLANLHPDKHGGDFASSEDKERYLRLNEADSFLEKFISEQSAIVSAEGTAELTKLVRDLVLENKSQRITGSELQLSEQIKTRISQLQKQYLGPKITVSAITGVLTYIWLLPGTLSEHPILKNYVNIDSPMFLTTWITSTVTTFTGLYATYVNEERQKKFQSQLKNEFYQNKIFLEFLQQNEKEFTKFHFIEFLTKKYASKDVYRNFLGSRLNMAILIPFFKTYRWLVGKLPLEVDEESARLVADIVFARAESGGAIRKVKITKYLEEVYTKTEIIE